MDWTMLLLLLAFCFLVETAPERDVYDFVQCKRSYKKIGCVHESHSIAPERLLSYRDKSSQYYNGTLINWRQFSESIHSLACECNDIAKAKSLKYFAIRFWGECYGGSDLDALTQIVRHGFGASKDCANIKFKECVDHSEDSSECVGKDSSEYMYLVNSDKLSEDVDGGYSEWTEFSKCSLSCGTGVMVRERTCSNPIPKGKGKDCSRLGPTTETKSCKLANCPIDGGYAHWSQFEECSRSCGIGVTKRSRYCTNPKPEHGGKPCPNGHHDEQTRPCKRRECPVDGGFTDWSDVSKCPVSCGDGLLRQTRTCTNPIPAHGGNDCQGQSERIVPCSTKVSCPVNGGLSPWSDYTACSATCGYGMSTRTRQCNNPLPAYGGRNCVGALKEETPCKILECPIDGSWSKWTKYGSCSSSCGVGKQTRTRTCNNPAPQHGGDGCIGEKDESKQCKIKDCPVDGGFSPWSLFTKCSKTCGEGTQTRKRTCTNPPPQHGGKACQGVTIDQQQCQIINCPVDGGFSEWSEFGKCSKTCGIGLQTRTRSCTHPKPAHNGKECDGQISDTRECRVKYCPVEGGYSPWSAYSSCSVTCGGGIQKRMRTCSNPPPAHGGKQCIGESVESRKCGETSCPVDGNWSEFSSYGECSVSCGLGTKSRSRKCTNPEPAHGGADCVGNDSQTIICKVKECPIDGGYSPWSKFTGCSVTCGEGEQRRTRHCNNPPPRHGGKSCEGPQEETKSCKVKECPVNGGFSEWTEFGQCSVTCGQGTQERHRTCDNPKPAHGGKACVGADYQTRKCQDRYCPVHGGFGSWSSYSKCSETCGQGKQTRHRSCDNPKPAHGGDDCVGHDEETKECKVKDCPVDGGYTTWSKYTQCSESCGDGTMKRTRTCTNPAPKHGGEQCKGAAEEVKSCNIKECPVDGGFAEWSSFGGCSKSCGEGQQIRQRKCTNPTPAHGGKNCVGKFSDSQICNLRPCPVDGGFSQWSQYDECTELCGGGVQERIRTCTNPAPKHGGKDCEGDLMQTRKCNTHKCKVDGGYGPWSSFTRCSKSCGEGQMMRTRQCVETRRDCSGPSKHVQPCKLRPCPVDGGLTSWTPFSACTKSCGDGTKTRTRSCTNPPPAHGGKGCIGKLVESTSCKVRECPVNGGFTAWSSFSTCSETCGNGVATRIRSCINPIPAHGGAPCRGKSMETKDCNVRECPVHGKWGAWSAYGKCNKPCGRGRQERYRKCNNPSPAHGGRACGGSNEETRACNTNPCPVNGGWSSWSAYGSCSLSCGGGQRMRTRRCTNPSPAHGGKACVGVGKETQSCNTRPCPVNGGLSYWSAFTKCSRSCGDGEIVRTRACTNPRPAHGGKMCVGVLKEVKTCRIRECPVNGNWGTWVGFTHCSLTCGGGTQARYRHCNNPTPAHGGTSCHGNAKEVRACNKYGCPVNGKWGSWSAFGGCNKHCGGGLQYRYRKCNSPSPANGGKQCSGTNTNTRSCNTHHCPVNGNWGHWGSYGGCNKHCGGGVQVSYRKCNNPAPAHGGTNCHGSNKMLRKCNIHHCPVNGNWGKWGNYGPCNKLCGGGVQERFRQCSNPAPSHGGATCPGFNKMVKVCNTRACPVNGKWGSWSAFGGCNKHCGGGLQYRYRKCNSPSPSNGGKQCPGTNTNTRSCNTHHCPVNGNWGSWHGYGSCSKNCGGGVKKRFRYCNNPAPAHGGANCHGSNYMSVSCNTHKCPVDGNWGHWGRYGACTAHCNGGVKKRYRSCNNPAPAHGGRTCAGSNAFVLVCNAHKCKVNGGWSKWGSYGKCSANCGGGVRERFRYCNNPAPAHGGAYCAGFSKMVEVCNTQTCTGWSSWGSWGSCTLPCNGGIRFRFRNCPKKYCPGSQSMVQVCNMHRCSGK